MKNWRQKLSLLLAVAMIVTTVGTDYVVANADEGEAPVEVAEIVETPAEEVVVEEAAPAEEVVEEVFEETTNEETEVIEETSQESEVIEETPAEETEEVIEGEETEGEEIEEELDPEDIMSAGFEDDLASDKKEEASEETSAESIFTFNVNNEEYGYVELIEETVAVESEDEESEDADETEDAEAAEKTIVVGAIAYANDGYEFVNWTDAEDNEVSADAEFRPEGEDEATYTANFEEAEAEEEEYLPAQEFEQVIDGVKITASAPEGAFPEGTVMNAEKVVITETIEAAIDDATDDDVEVKEIIAYDITFTKDDEEVQPKVAINVEFSNVEIEGENLQVFHMEDEEAEAEPVSEVVENTDEIEVQAESFSLYVLVGSEYVQLKTGEKVELSVGETKKILTNDKSNLDLSIGYSIESVTWSVKNSDIASVGKASTYTSGGTTYYTSEITGNKVGTTTVTVTFEYYKSLHSSKTTKKSFTYDVNVKAASASGNSEVACFATAGGQEMNADMAALLGLDPKAHNSAGYYPVGVITLPNTMLSKSTSNDKGCIVTDDDFNALLGAIGVIDPSRISTNAKWAGNRNNTVGDHIASVQKDLGGKGQGSNCTALFYWNKAEHDSSNPEYVVSGKNYYKYHLDMRFTTVTVTYKKMSDGNEIGKQVYLKSTPSIDPKDTIGSYLSSLGDDYEILGYYTKREVKPEYKYTFNQSLEDNLTLYLDLKKVDKVTVVYDVNGGKSTTTTPTPVNGKYTFNNLKVNSDMKYVNQPTRDNYTFIGWKEESTGNVIAQDALPKRVTRNETYTAQWLKSTVDEEIVVTIKGKSDSAEYDGNLHEVSGYEVVSITMDGKAYTEYTEDDFELAVGAKAYASGTTIGTYNMFLTNKSFKNNNEKFTNVKFVVEDGVLTITKIQTPVTIIVDGNQDTREYTGTEQTYYGYKIQSYDSANITVNGPAQNAKIARGTDAGKYYMGLSNGDFTVSSDVYETVNLKVNDGWLEITPKDSYEITVTGKSETKEYTGQTQSTSGYDFGTFDSTVITITKQPGNTAKAEGITVGEYKQNLTQDMFAATSKNYTQITFKVNPGKLTIVASTKPYVITVNGKSETKVYNGQKQSVPGYEYAEYDQTITVNGPAQESVKAEGTNVGEYKTIFDESKFSASSKNYEKITFKFVPGTLKITKADKYEVQIVGNTKTTTYNRSEQNVTGYTITNPDTSVKVDGPTQAEAIAKGTNVGTYPMNLEGKFTATSDNYKEVTVKVTDGWLKINKDEKPYVITVNGKSDTKEYSGQTQSVTGYTYADYDSSIKVTGPAQEAVIASGKDAGTYKQNLLVNDFSATSDNYGNISFKVNPGTLTITKSKTPYTITVNGKSDTKEYNGQTQSVTGYEYAEYDETITVSGPAQEAVKAEGINAGEYTQNLSAGQFSATSDNYETINFTVNPGKLTIVASKTPYTITVNGKSDEKEYTGQTQSVTGYDYVAYDNTITVSGPEQDAVIASGKDAGEYPQNLSASQFSATSNNYETINFTVNPGKLTIVASKTPYEIVVNGKSDEKEYTGQTQSVTGYDYEDYDNTITVSGPEQDAVIASGKDAGEYPQNLSAGQFSATSDNYETITFSVNPGKLTIVASKTPYVITVNGKSDTKEYNGTTQSVTGYEYVAYDNTITVSGPAQESVKAEGINAGEYNQIFDESKFSASSKNYEDISFAFNPGKLTIVASKTPYTITVNGKSDTKEYNGQTQSVTGYEYAEYDETITVSGPEQAAVIASGKDAGEYTQNLSAGQFSATSDNYETINFTVNPGKLTIVASKKPYVITVNGKSDEKEYTGQTQSVTGYEYATYDNTITVSGPEQDDVKAEGINAGEYQQNLVASQFNATSDNYETITFSVNPGKLTIVASTKPYVITVNGKSASKTYDGTTQSVTGYEYAEYDNTITVSGPAQESVKAEGINAGEYNQIFDESKFSASSKNYEDISFTFNPGILTITKADKYEVLIVGNTKTTTYNRSEQNVTGYTITNPDTSVKVDGPTQAEAIAKGTNVGTYPMNLEGKFTASSENYKEVTVKVTDGWLKINKDEKPYVITVNGKSDTKEYSGQTQSVTGYTYADYDSSIKVTGPAQEAVIASGKDAGTYKQNLLVNDFSATSDNYGNISFKVNPGTLTITKSKTPYTITVNGKSDTKEYNGQTQSVTGYEYAEYDETITVSGPAQETVKAEGINAGEYTQNLSAGQFSATSDNYETINFTVNPGKLTIVASKTPYTITVNGKSDTKEYNGTTQSVTGYDYAEYDNTITVSGPEQDAVIASGKDAGEYPQNLSASQFSASSNNYETINFTVNPGTLTIVASKTPYEIVVNGKSDEKEYTGQTQSVTGYDYEDYDETIEVSGPEQAAVIASGKDAGEYPQNLSAGQFSATSDNYETINFTVNPGTLKIIASKTPYEIEVTGNSYNLIYNKEEQKFFGFTIGDYDETIEITQPAQEDVFVTGTDAGDYELPVDVSLFDASSDNYETITFVPVSGMCKITPIEDEYIVTIKGNKDTKTYSGYEQKVTGYEVTNPDATVTVTGPDQESAIASGTNVGTYPMGLDEKYFSAESKNYTNIKVVVEDGSLEIIKAVVTVDIEGNTDTVVYDGNSHSVNGWKASLHESSASNAPDNLKYDVSKVTYEGNATAKGTNVGTYKMNLDAGLFRGNDDNYEVSFDVIKDGKLVINPQPYYPPDEPDPTPDPDPVPPAIIPEPPVPLAPTIDNDVLGARRTLGNGSVLGARRGMDQAVLGKRRSPNTGDSSMLSWVVALMGSLSGIAGSVVGLKKTKKKEDED